MTQPEHGDRLSVTGFGVTSAILPRPGLDVPLVRESSMHFDGVLPEIADDARAMPRPFQQVLDVEVQPDQVRVTLERFCGVEVLKVARELRQVDRALPLDVWLALADAWLRAIDQIPQTRRAVWHTPWTSAQLGVELTGAITLTIDEFNHVLGHFGRELTARAGVMGHLPYSLSPEHVRGVTPLPSSRVHSLGSALISLLTFERPFGAPNEFQMLQNLIEGRARWTPALHPQCTPQLAAVLDRAIQLEPKDRWPTVEALRVALRDAAGVEPAGTQRLAGVVFGANPARLKESIAALEAQPQFLPPTWAAGGLKVLEDQLLEQLVPIDSLPVLARASAAKSEAAPRINLAGGRRVPISAPRVNLAPAGRPWWRRLLGLSE